MLLFHEILRKPITGVTLLTANSGFAISGYSATLNHRSNLLLSFNLKHCVKLFRSSQSRGTLWARLTPKTMKLKDIFSDNKTSVFLVTDQDEEDELNWTIEPTDFDLLPEEENIYYVKAFQVSEDNTTDCYIGIMTPERIAETIVKRQLNGKIVTESIYDQENSIIPAVASECIGEYELYYAKENPQIGIDVLRDGLTKAVNKNIVAEDLGFILRDENRIEEAIEAFKISENTGPSSEYVYFELSRLYRDIGQIELELKYKEKFRVNG